MSWFALDARWRDLTNTLQIGSLGLAMSSIELPGPRQLGPPQSYLYGVWIDASEDEPVEWFDELDALRWSIRCVRKYRDGRLEACSYEISKAEFEIVWNQANSSAAG